MMYGTTVLVSSPVCFFAITERSEMVSMYNVHMFKLFLNWHGVC